MQLSQDAAQKRLCDMGITDMPLIAVRTASVPVSPDWFAQYRALCRQFMMTLTDAVEELSFLNLSQDEFMGLLMGRRMPPNMSIRFRTPLVWGGKMEISNLFMCRTFPISHNLDRFIIAQIGADTVWLPNPAKKIYVSAHTIGGGDGGNATEDRLSQLAAQIAANRGME
ncbi:MAG: hypothetical protein NC311_03265 [Muribaculaceae bacterium]|nr:hypothetical protein [Muribaculaceae bacterium]